MTASGEKCGESRRRAELGRRRDRPCSRTCASSTTEEEKNDPALRRQKLAKLADVYVNDARRRGASRARLAPRAWRTGVSSKAIGLLMEKELKFLGEELENPKKPFVVILGGAKVSDKIAVIDRLLEKADTILIGGAMAYTFAPRAGKKDRQVA